MLRIQASFSQAVKEKFDQRTAYEHNNLLHPRFAAKVVAQTKLQEGWKVLDLACGTGLVTYAAGKAVGPEGTVLGLDISPVMLQQVFCKDIESFTGHLLRAGNLRHNICPTCELMTAIEANFMAFGLHPLQSML